MTIEALLSDGVAVMQGSSASPRADAQLLLAVALRRDRTWIAAHSESEPSAEQAEAFARLCARRHEGAPIAYILGSAGFYGREFTVNENVLVPRPETEHLVEEAIGFVRGPMRVLDVGVGSGAVACTIAAETAASVDGTDVSTGAIEVANCNARRLGVAERCRFYAGDLIEPVRSRRYGVVIANLPYIPTGDLPQPPDPVSFEPREALDGGPDGLALYRKLIPQLPGIVDEGALILLEAAPPTIAELAALANAALPNFTVSIVEDYANLPRYIRATRTHSSGTASPRSGV